jgi:hypothetical protein
MGNKNIIIDRIYFDRVMSDAVGPTPWYINKFPAIKFNKEDLIWEKSAEWKTLLKAISDVDKIYLVLNSYCYVKSMGQDNLLIWHKKWHKQKEYNGIKDDGMTVLLFSINSLSPINKIKSISKKMRNGKDFIVYSSGLKTAFNIPILSLGEISFTFPDELKEITEILMLGNFKPKKDEINQNGIYEAIYSLRPKESKIIVSAENWFNLGDFDYGYAWITRVVRDPKTKYIFGDGIRLGGFVLDDNRNKFLGWINHVDIENLPVEFKNDPAILEQLNPKPIFIEKINDISIFIQAG